MIGWPGMIRAFGNMFRGQDKVPSGCESGRWTAAVLLFVSVSLIVGCSSQRSTDVEPAGEEARSLAEAFNAPTLAELDARAQWQERPVGDPNERLAARQAKEPRLATVAEALALRNTSDESNAKILSALSRLPESDAEVNWDGTLIRHIGGDIRTSNPIMVSSAYEMEVAGQTGLGLLAFDWSDFTNYATSETVRSWQTSADHLVDKIVLRDDLTWSDGKPITAYDIEFTWQTLMDTRIPVPAMRSGPDKLQAVKAYDARTVVFFHKEALATNDTDIQFAIIPKHLYEKTIPADYTLMDSDEHVRLENNPVCGGPYKIASRVRGQEVTLERRDDWYMHAGKQVRPKPHFKRIRFRVITDDNTALLALKTGEVDEALLRPQQWMNQTTGDDYYERNTKARGTEWVYFYFGWNNKTPFFSDVRVRKAMSYAYDYDEMLSKLCYGLYEPCSGVFHPTAWMAPKPAPAPYKQDHAKSRELLTAAGWTDSDNDGVLDREVDGKRVRFEFTIVCAQSALATSVCAQLKQNLEPLGIVCNVKPMEYAQLQDKTQKHEFQAMMGGWGTGTDPDTSDNLWVTDEGRNFVQYSNPEVDRLYKAGAREFDRAKRAEIYGQIARILYEDQPYTWLYYRSSFYGFNKQLRGYTFSPRGVFGHAAGMSALWKAAE